MSNKTKLVYSALIVIVLFGIYVSLNMKGIDFNQNPTRDENVVCTMEAKLCPDGSYVGRSGPKCEFAKCPGQTYKGQKLNQSFTLNSLKITPIKILEDSRCAEGTQCIWAGRVVVKTKFEYGENNSKEVDVEVGKSIEVLGHQIVLQSIMPNKTNLKINDEDYWLLYTAQVVEE